MNIIINQNIEQNIENIISHLNLGNNNSEQINISLNELDQILALYGYKIQKKTNIKAKIKNIVKIFCPYHLIKNIISLIKNIGKKGEK